MIKWKGEKVTHRSPGTRRRRRKEVTRVVQKQTAVETNVPRRRGTEDVHELIRNPKKKERSTRQKDEGNL